VRFLEGLGAVLGHHRCADDIVSELEQDSELQQRLRALLEEPMLNHGNAASPSVDPRTVEFLELLAETLESRDTGMRGHAQRVAFYTGLMTDQLCLGRTLQHQARVTALLHDLGKAGLPTAVLPESGVLSPPQRAAVEQHPLIAERLVRPLGLPSAIVDALRHHHERWDGKGYPDGVKGSEIPLIARIVSIADAYDAMVCDSSYQPARSRSSAISELRDHAGGQFDPALVEIFIEIAEAGIRTAPDIELKPNCEEALEFAEYLTSEISR
jgi:HD-GYP domain-containing protein (c-di-GMP phosphodiesterase class II)